LKKETNRGSGRIEGAVSSYKGVFYLLRICQRQV